MTEQYCSFVSVCVAYSSIGIFRCDFFHLNFLQQSHSEISLLLSTCASLYCSHAKQSKEDLDDIEQQAKATLPTGTAELSPNETRKQQKNDKSAFGSDALD